MTFYHGKVDFYNLKFAIETHILKLGQENHIIPWTMDINKKSFFHKNNKSLNHSFKNL